MWGSLRLAPIIRIHDLDPLKDVNFGFFDHGTSQLYHVYVDHSVNMLQEDANT